jgi:hypothetical protein
LSDKEIYEKAARRAKANGVDMTMYSNIIIFLEKEIDDYRAKIQRMKAYIDGVNERAARLAQQSEAMQENTTTEIIKALSDNGYNTITINCYKDIESEV